MAKFQIFDENFKQQVSGTCKTAKEKLSDAVLTEEGRLDTEKISAAARNAVKKVEGGVKEGYQKFSDNFIDEQGRLDTDKVEDAVTNTYHKAGRRLATSMTRLAGKLAGKFGIDGENTDVIDSEVVAGNTVEADEDDFV